MALFGSSKKKQEEAARIAAEQKAAEEARVAEEVAAFAVTDETSVTAALRRGVELHGVGMHAHALTLFQKGAEYGNRYAQSMLASLYYRGEGAEKDYQKALYWYMQSAKQGSADAQYHVALMLLDGEGADKSNLDALKWLQEAAKQDHADAKDALIQKVGTKEKYQAFMAEGCFQKYKGCLKHDIDAETALGWLNKAAEYGCAEAQYNLGAMYEEGCDVEQNFAEAAKWYRAAAEQGLAKAQFLLANMYANGLGVEQSDAEGMKWMRAAAEQGLAEAQYVLSQCYAQGLGGVEQDREKYRDWCKKAADQGFEPAKQEYQKISYAAFLKVLNKDAGAMALSDETIDMLAEGMSNHSDNN